MTTLTPTRATGATAKPAPGLYVEEVCAVTDEQLAAPMADTGLNGAFVADLLSAALTHERCGTHLYRSVAGRTNNPMLKARYEEFGKETLRHAEILEDLVAGMGGDPQYISPMARALQGTDTAVLESTFRLDGTIDLMVREMVMLDAVVLAETIHHAHWTNLTQLCAELDEGNPVRESLMAAVDEAGPQKDEHLRWATDTKSQMTMMQVRSSLVADVGQKVEDLVETVRGWFS